MQKSNPLGKTNWSQHLVILSVILFLIVIVPNVILLLPVQIYFAS
jgi:hypothetical protein